MLSRENRLSNGGVGSARRVPSEISKRRGEGGTEEDEPKQPLHCRFEIAVDRENDDVLLRVVEDVWRESGESGESWSSVLRTGRCCGIRRNRGRAWGGEPEPSMKCRLLARI